MREVSTRVWLGEKVWTELQNRAAAEGTTVRELIPRLVGRGLTGSAEPAPAVGPAAPATTQRPGPTPAESAEPEAGPPVIVLSSLYRCDVCGGQVKLGGLTIHMGKHMKERQAADAERS